ncbi:HV309 protein, partial [Alopecoenas beccarii]|nr:HV309 protein [Alopecoenas beccarii]
QLRLVEAGRGLRAPMLLSCRGYGFTFRNYRICWFHHAAGGRPKRVIGISYHSVFIEYDTELQDRVTLSRNNSWSKSPLSLHALHPRDSAHYFCTVSTETGNPGEV